MPEVIDTIFGRFSGAAKKRLDLTYDYETSAIRSFRGIAEHIRATQIVDIGANVGVYSVYTSGIATIRAVHAFEPAPQTLGLLQQNVAVQTNPDMFTVYNMALTNIDGEIRFKIVSLTSGTNRIAGDAPPSETDIVVPAHRLDSVLQLENEIIAIKIDVEGHELPTIDGAVDLLSRNKCFMQIERHVKPEGDQLGALLEGLGYMHLFSLNNDHLYIHRDFASETKPLLDIVARNVTLDLRSLKELRRGKRAHTLEVYRLWQAAGYKKDPLLS